MALSTKIDFATLEELYLDPRNPRLGLSRSEQLPTQERVMELVRSWSLEELAVSFLENGYWPQEAVIVVEEELYGPPANLVVVEGNRRVAALKYLKLALSGQTDSRVWRRMSEDAQPDERLFEEVPYIRADSRQDVIAFLGFRHVTGIKEWDPPEKAEFIAHMIDDLELSYDSVRKQIGSRTETVRRNYIAFRILQQINSLDIEVSEVGIRSRFSVLFLSLREAGVQSFLGVNILADPKEAQIPVPESRAGNLADFSRWLFGTDREKPLFTDSRYVGNFARVLSSQESVEYLRYSPSPSFDLALQKAGVEDEEIEGQLREASNQMELALSRVHLHLDSDEIQKAVRRLALNARELISKFPSISEEVGLWGSTYADD